VILSPLKSIFWASDGAQRLAVAAASSHRMINARMAREQAMCVFPPARRHAGGLAQ
jgi:hypothetical protein